MPQILVRGLKASEVASLCRDCLGDLARINETPEDYYLFQRWEPETYSAAGAQPSYPLVEVKQFRRSPEQEAQTARLVLDYIRGLGYEEAELYYVYLEEQAYYSL